MLNGPALLMVTSVVSSFFSFRKAVNAVANNTRTDKTDINKKPTHWWGGKTPRH